MKAECMVSLGCDGMKMYQNYILVNKILSCQYYEDKLD